MYIQEWVYTYVRSVVLRGQKRELDPIILKLLPPTIGARNQTSVLGRTVCGLNRNPSPLSNIPFFK